MRILFTALVCLFSFNVFGQNVNIPDANFKTVLVEDTGPAGVNTNGDDEIQVSEAAAYDGWIWCQALNIQDMTGIEAFTSITHLYCDENQITSLDLSGNTALKTLSCWGNQLTSLVVSQNSSLLFLSCFDNQLTSLDVSHNLELGLLACWENQLTTLDVSQNSNLAEVQCWSNQITSLDVSQNTSLGYVQCQGNQLTYLNVANGNNLMMGAVPTFNATNNPYLSCIEVDDASWSTANWTVSSGHIDAQHYFSNDCEETGIDEHNRIKKLLKCTDLLGREVNHTPNQILFHLYDDGSVEKKFVVE